MKRSIIAIAAFMLLLSSTTYAAPSRPVRHPLFWGSLLIWLGLEHHNWGMRVVREYEHGRRPPEFVPGHACPPPEHRERESLGRGWHRGWLFGGHYGWDRNDQNHGDRQKLQGPQDGDNGHGREGGRG